ncbi:MAG: CopG family transcriptional regulator [Victivallales bacterium]|mgnify:FL=1|jgi:putative iron-only hydrogenase system regulator|nr:CopG family transcriptional regulator [Victivallales bacterium]
MDKRIGVIAILIDGQTHAVGRVNELLSEYSDIIIGRLGIPYREKGVSVISITVEGTTDEVGALSGKLGMVEGAKTKSLLLTK